MNASFEREDSPVKQLDYDPETVETVELCDSDQVDIDNLKVRTF
jgi:hypothetical protein